MGSPLFMWVAPGQDSLIKPEVDNGGAINALDDCPGRALADGEQVFKTAIQTGGVETHVPNDDINNRLAVFGRER